MSLVQHRDKVIGWAYESITGTDPITSGAVPYYEFGKNTQGFGKFPSKTFKTLATHHGSRDPVLNITHHEPKTAIACSPTNSIPWYWFLGSSSTTTGVHTITGIDTGEIPSLTLRFQSQNATENIRKSMVGSKLSNINLQVSNINTRMRMPAILGVGFQGMDVKAPSYTSDYDPVYAGSNESMYFVDSNFAFHWDSSADNINYSNYMTDFKYIGVNTNQFGTVNNSISPFGILEGVRTHILQFQIFRGADTSIYDDYLAQTRSSTGKNAYMTIWQDATNYLTLTFGNVFIEDIPLNDAVQQRGESELYDVVATCETLTVTSKDGLTAATFYGE